MADVITREPESIAVPAPQWGVATRKYAVEAIGAFFLTFAVGVAALSGSVFVPLTAGAMLMVMIYAGGHISGGHYNPAVTMAALVRRRIGIGDAVAYWIAQVVGGVIAGLLARAVVNPALVKTLTLSGHAEAAAAVVELLITFALFGSFSIGIAGYAAVIGPARTYATTPASPHLAAAATQLRGEFPNGPTATLRASQNAQLHDWPDALVDAIS